MKYMIIAVTALSMAACTSKPEKIVLRTEKGPRNEQVEVKVNANNTLKMEIQGMTCEMGCGGTIRTALKETEAVARVQYDFKDGAKVQTAMISFDDTKISPEKMVDIVEKLNDHQFSVGNYQLVETAESSTNEASKVVHEEKPVINMGSSVKLPNLFGILKDLILR